jgi:hypothetical protein
LSIAMGQRTGHASQSLPWEQEVGRFFAALKKFDDFLPSTEPLHAPIEKLFPWPVAAALAIVGLFGMLRRLTHAPMKGESYYEAEIEMGRVGANQARPKREF